jgi:hypothetical protein
MTFTSCDKILATIRATDDPARKQGNNRAKINQLFNGAPLLSEEDARKLSLKINCNFGEAPVLGQHGRRQYQNAFLSRSNFFTIRLPDAPVEKQAEWSAFITKKINKTLKRSLQYFELQRLSLCARFVVIAEEGGTARNSAFINGLHESRADFRGLTQLTGNSAVKTGLRRGLRQKRGRWEPNCRRVAGGVFGYQPEASGASWTILGGRFWLRPGRGSDRRSGWPGLS